MSYLNTLHQQAPSRRVTRLLFLRAVVATFGWWLAAQSSPVFSPLFEDLQSTAAEESHHMNPHRGLFQTGAQESNDRKIH